MLVNLMSMRPSIAVGDFAFQFYGIVRRIRRYNIVVLGSVGDRIDSHFGDVGRVYDSEVNAILASTSPKHPCQ